MAIYFIGTCSIRLKENERLKIFVYSTWVRYINLYDRDNKIELEDVTLKFIAIKVFVTDNFPCRYVTHAGDYTRGGYFMHRISGGSGKIKFPVAMAHTSPS